MRSYMNYKLLSTWLLCMFFVSAAYAQTGTLTGTVTDSRNGEEIPGVNLFIPDLDRGGGTDLDGEYRIQNIPLGEYTLEVSFIGYEQKELTVDISAGINTVNIELEQDLVGLDEIVITAYGISREKRSVAYQTENISSDDLNLTQNSSPAEGLVGKVAGLQINNQSSSVKSENQIILRGLRSISGNNEPLIVIDGSIASTGAFRDMNPNDIENINVLKGATAAALYGSDASNGALIVTTKKGGEGTGITVQYNHSTTFEEVAYMPDFQTKFGTGWDGEYNPVENTNWGPRFDGQPRRIGPDFPANYAVEDQVVPYAPIEDNLQEFFNRGAQTQNTISLLGGDESGSFYLSVGNEEVSGLVPNDDYSKYTITANGSKKLGDITLSVNTSFFQDDKNVVGNDIGDQDRAFYWFVLNTPANIPLTEYSNWQDPTSYGYADNYFNAYYQNPYWAIGTNRDKDETNRLRGNVSASWDIVDNINVIGRLGINNVSGIGKYYRAAQDYNADLQPAHSPVSSFVTDSEFQSTDITGNLLASGDFQLNEDIGLNALVGTAVEISEYRESEMTANNLSIPGFFDVSNATGEVQTTVDEFQERSYGIFSEIELNYREWAFLNLTGRQDFTSTLPSEDNSYFYPGAGISVILNEAVPAINDISFISMLKLTANNSTVYKDLSPYQVNETFSQSSSFPYGSINGFFLANTAVDENIQKEKLNTTEFGLNSAFLDGRVTFNASYYFTKTTDLITTISPSFASGATGYLTNIGELSGDGLELSLGGNVIERSDFAWNVGLNYTSYEQRVEEISEGVDEISIETYTGGYGTYAIKGEVFPQIKAISYVRDDQGRIVIDPSTGNPLIGDLKAMGKTTPDYSLGLNTSVSYKGLRLAATMDYRTGHIYYAQGQDMMEFTGRSVESAAANRNNFVFPNSSFPDGNGGYVANTNIPITGGVGPFWRDHYNQIKENYVKDATAFKLRELAITYSLPIQLLDKMGNVVKGLSVGLIGRNLLTVLPDGQTTFSDPEFKNTGTGYESNGIGVGGYLSPPPTRSYGFNVKIEF